MDLLIANNEEDYINKAVDIASDLGKLNEIRDKLFNYAISSPLFDKKKFSSNFYKLIENIKQN